MARIIPQAQPDPFAPQTAGLYSTRDRPSTKFQTINRFLDTAKAVTDSPLTGLALRGIQAGAGGISDMLADAAARRMDEYKSGGLGEELSPDLADPEPYKPMDGLSLRGDKPEGLGLSLRDMPEQPPATVGSSESRMGELQDTLGADLARAAQRKLGIAPQEPLTSAGKRVLADRAAGGLDLSNKEANIAGATGMWPGDNRGVPGKGILPAFTSPRVPGLEMDVDAARLDGVMSRPAAPSAPLLPQAPLPRVPTMPRSTPLPTAEQLGERRRNPPLTLDSGATEEPMPPPPPIATQTDADRDIEQQMRDDAWRKFIDGDDGQPPVGPEPRPNLRLDMVPGLSDLPEPAVALEDVQAPGAELDGLAEAAPVLGRSKRLSAATDEQLAGIRKSLQGDDPETLRRIAQIDREMQQRSDLSRVANRALTPEELIKRARMAGTQEEQAQVLADSARVRLPITSVADLIGDQREKAFRQELMGTFPVAPKKTAEQIAADIALLEAKAQERRDAAALASARARGEDVRAPAQAEKSRAEGARALAQGGTEESKRELNRSNAGLADQKAMDLAATLASRNAKRMAEANRAQAAADKFLAEAQRVKARAASVGRGGAGAGDIHKDIKSLKNLQDASDDAIKQANDMAKDASVDARAAARAAEDAKRILIRVGDPGPAPVNPASVDKNADPKIRAEAMDNYAKWQAKTGEYEQARKDLANAEADAENARNAIKAAESIRTTAQGAAKEYDAAKAALRARVERKLGVAPRGAVAPTAPAAPVTTPTGMPAEGSEYTSNGKTYRIQGGKPVRIK